MTVLDIACAAEGPAYAPHSAAMLDSVFAHNPGSRIRIHYLPGPGIEPKHERKLAQMVTERGGEIQFLRVPDERLAGIPTEGFTRKATWYRIFLPDLLPDADRVLYLDSDLIVVDSLEPLLEIDLTGHHLAAVTNVLEPMYVQHPAELGIPHGRYFNAGVLLMNLREMREHGCSEALRAYAVENAERLMWRDQDALNVVLGERRLPLHPRWNCMNSIVLGFPYAGEVFTRDQLEEARANPAIRHFEGPGENKPWDAGAEPEARELYLAHRRRTPWPRVSDGVGVSRRVIARMRRRRRRVRSSLEDR